MRASEEHSVLSYLYQVLVYLGFNALVWYILNYNSKNTYSTYVKVEQSSEFVVLITENVFNLNLDPDLHQNTQ